MAEHIDWTIRLATPGGTPMAMALTSLVFAVLAATYWELRRLDSWRKRLVLGGLRLASATCILLVGLQPAWMGQRSIQSDGALAVLADMSRSMAVRDGDGLTRAEQAQALFRRWRQGDVSAIEVHGFGEDLLPADLRQLSDLYPTSADDTRIATALRATVEMDRSQELGAIVLVSDGADLADPPDWSVLDDLGLPVHTVGMGDPDTLRDQSVADVKADARAFLREPARIEVIVRSTGGMSGRVPVTLRRGKEVVREVFVDVPPAGEATAEIEFVPHRLGRDAYSVSIPVHSHDQVPENNERAFLMTVVRDRLRVLLVCGHPSWDARFLRGFLKADPSIDLVSFYILRTVNDMIQANPDELSLIPFPTEELFDQHLDSFDVVLFQNFEFGPYRMARYLPRIRDFVRGGGAFAMIGGERSLASGGYARTAVAEVLPVTLHAAEHARVSEAPFTPRVVEEARWHPLLAWRPEEGASREAWRRLAPLVGMNLVERANPNADVLLVHPELKTGAGSPMPLLVLGDFGQGRSMVLATDASWRWGITTAGRKGDASAYSMFWDRALRWLARDPSLDPTRIDMERAQVGTDSPLAIRAEVRDARYAPLALTPLEMVIEDARGKLQSVTEGVSDGEGVLQARLPPPEQAGAYRLTVRKTGAEQPLAEAGFVVELGGEELARPTTQHATLREIARRTGGRYYAPDAAPSALKDFEATRTRVLGMIERRPFSETWFVLLMIATLALEWAIRRAYGRA